jgi:hypothetical protein
MFFFLFSSLVVLLVSCDIIISLDASSTITRVTSFSPSASSISNLYGGFNVGSVGYFSVYQSPASAASKLTLASLLRSCLRHHFGGVRTACTFLNTDRISFPVCFLVSISSSVCQSESRHDVTLLRRNNDRRFDFLSYWRTSLGSNFFLFIVVGWLWEFSARFQQRIFQK